MQLPTISTLLVLSTSLAIHGGYNVVVDAHGYLKSPRSRNYVASVNPIWWGGTETDPAPENCPHCLNIGGTEARCGKVGDHNYDYPPNAIGTVLGPNTQECYEESSVIDIKSVLTAHHKGHFEVKACPIQPGEVATQACFDSNPLEFVSDEFYGAPKDELYPGRAYIPNTDYMKGLFDPDGNFLSSDGTYNFHHKYKLPDGLKGDLILLQWYYLTGNSCTAKGYDTYPFPDGFDPGVAECVGEIPPDGRGVPEQFWNCAEVEIKVANGCGDTDPSPSITPSPTPSPVKAQTMSPVPDGGTGDTTTSTSSTSVTTTAATTTTTTSNNSNLQCKAETQQCGPTITCESIGFPGLCCSEYGWCDNSAAHCGDCCQNGPCLNNPPSPTPPSPTPPTPTPPTGDVIKYNADHGEDSRMIAYVGNWQTCPTTEQVDSYSHIVIAFSVSYTWSLPWNSCNTQCTIEPTVPICNGGSQALVDSWRAAGKKVILSFGGAGMGGSWAGDKNNCWDYCFDREEELSTSLVNIVSNQNFDGIDLDYEYCYDTEGQQAGRCTSERDTGLYSDAKAQTFLSEMTYLLRTKLDNLQASNGYNRGRYELTHAPMDSDLLPTSKYFEILHQHRADLDFLMPQFYNGVTRPAVDGVDGTGAGALSAAAMFDSLSNELFDSEPNKVVFGHCISDCGGTGSNTNAAQAVQVTADLKEYNDGEFECNGGAFFWVAAHDNAWSSAVVQEISKTAGCSTGVVSTSSPTSSPVAETLSPTFYPTDVPSSSPIKRSRTSSPSKSTVITDEPSKSPSKSPSESPVEASTTTSSTTTTTTSSSTTTTTTEETNSPSNSPTKAPIPSPTLPPVPVGSNSCVAIPQSELPAGKWATNDVECSKCEGTDPYQWWPCDVDICDCSGKAPPGDNCLAQTNVCGPDNPCPNNACCSQWGYCGVSEDHCGECCQSGNCLPF